MIPNEDQLEAIAQIREGDLAEIPFAVLLHAFAQKERSTVLKIERGPLKKDIFFERGVPVECRSNLLHETLLQVVIDRGYIDEQRGQHCLKRRVELGVQIGEVLILEGILNASELYKLMQQNLASKLLDGFTWRDGHFRILSQPPRVDSPLKVKVPQLVVIGVSKFATQDEVNSAIGPLVGNRLFLHPKPPYPLADIRFTTTQRKLIDLLHAGKRIDELAAETTVPFDEIMRLLYSLAVIGLVVPESRLPKGVAIQAPRPAPPKPAAPASPPPAAEPPPANVEERRNKIMEAYLRYRKLDAFELLGVGEETLPVDIQQSFLEYSRKFAPWTLPKALDALREKAEDLFIAGGLAFGELSNPETRNALITRRRHQRDEKSKSPDPDRFAIKTDLLDSKLQFRKGKALMEAGKYREALQQLRFAHEFEPQNALYRAELAYCNYMNGPSQHEGEKALTELEAALRIDPKLGLGYYHAGQICSDLGKVEEGADHLQKAIKLMAPDRRPIEAMKVLQTKKPKKGLFSK